MEILTLPCTEREFLKWIEEIKEPPFEYAFLQPDGSRSYTLKAMYFIFRYLVERFGDQPATAELVEKLKLASRFYWKNEGDRDELVNKYPQSFEDDRHIDIKVATANLLAIKRILDQAGIEFWLMYGTFLGAYRNNAIIPWDEDTDLAIYAEDSSLLLGCKEKLIKEGFAFGSDPIMATVIRGGEHTDFYFFFLEGSERVWQRFRYPADDFAILNTINFLNTTWRIFNNPERWLTYTYGKDWRTPIVGKKATNYPYGEADV